MRKLMWASLALCGGFVLSGCDDSREKAGSFSIPPAEKDPAAETAPGTPEPPKAVGRRGAMD